MSYRNITVDGVEYKYSVGKTHVAIRGLGAYSNNMVCGYPNSCTDQMKVTPSKIADWIRSVR